MSCMHSNLMFDTTPQTRYTLVSAFHAVPIIWLLMLIETQLSVMAMLRLFILYVDDQSLAVSLACN